MIPDFTGLPLAGGAFLGSAAYVALSLFVTGPLVAERTIEKSGWPELCARQMRGAASAPVIPQLPAIDCESVLGTFYGVEGVSLCARFGRSLDPLGALLGQPLDAARRRGEDQARRAGSACGCATTYVVEQRRFEFALHAGTARLMTPRPVRDLEGELDRALSSPPCRVGG